MAKRNGMTQAQKLERYPQLEAEYWQVALMLSDVMNQTVTFGAWMTEKDGSQYRVGISMRAEPLCMVTFYSKGQRDAITVYGLEQFTADLYRQRIASESVDALYRALYSAKDAVRAKQAA